MTDVFDLCKFTSNSDDCFSKYIWRSNPCICMEFLLGLNRTCGILKIFLLVLYLCILLQLSKKRFSIRLIFVLTVLCIQYAQQRVRLFYMLSKFKLLNNGGCVWNMSDHLNNRFLLSYNEFYVICYCRSLYTYHHTSNNSQIAASSPILHSAYKYFSFKKFKNMNTKYHTKLQLLCLILTLSVSCF